MSSGPSRQVLRRGDLTLAYERSGSGPPILLIQGVGVVGACWRPQVAALAGHYQTLFFDNRGIGESTAGHGPVRIEAMAEDARALMDEAGWDSAHVMGHSMGGVIAQQLALDCPKRVRSLSLLCTFARGRDAARVTPWVLWMTLRTRLGTRRMRRSAFLKMLWSSAELARADREQLAADVGALVGRDLAVQPPILMKQVMALSRHDVSSQLGRLAGIPTLVVSAEEDPIAPPRYGRKLAAAIPGARYEEIPGASHAVTIQKPGEVNRRLLDFLASCEAPVVTS